MKNTKSLLVISILLISLMFTACNKESEVSETTQSEEPITTEDSLDSTVSDTTVSDTTEDNNEGTDKAPADNTQSEPSASVTVDSAGSNVKLEEDDLIAVTPDEQKENKETSTQKQETTKSTNKSDNHGMAMSEEEALADIQNMLDNGDIDQAMYDELLEVIQDTYHPQPIVVNKEPRVVQSTEPIPEGAKAMSKNDLPPNSTRGEIQWGQGDYSDVADIKIN